MDHADIHVEVSTAPPNAKGFMISASDGVRLRVGLWQAEGECHGSIMFFPGRGDYIELYGHPVSAFVAAGFNVLVIDWRGHGLSDRIAANPKVGHINTFADYQLDVDAMVTCIDELALEQPLFLVAHSMGACIGLRALINGINVRAAAFTAPMFGISMAMHERALAWPLTWALSAIGQSRMYAPGFNDDSYVFRHAFEENTLTNSREDYERWIMQGKKYPELHTGGPSVGWLFAALKECHELQSLPSPDVPCLTICGDRDETVVIDAIQKRLGAWPAGRLEQMPNAKHEIFLELPALRDLATQQIISFCADPELLAR